jgi:hypothetical protein
MVHFTKPYLWLLRILSNNSGDFKLSSRLLKSAKAEDLLVICELAKNILEGNVPISDNQKEKLKKYENKLILLSEPNKKIKDKVNILLKHKLLFKQLILIGEEFLINTNYNSESEEGLETDESE